MTETESVLRGERSPVTNAWPRIAAFLLDYLLILVYLVILALVGLFLTLGPLAEVWSTLVSTPPRRDLLAFFMTVFPVTAYFVVSERSPAGGIVNLVGSR